LNLELVKNAFLSTGLYRKARVFERLLDRAKKDAYQRDKSFYANILPQNPVLCFDVGANVGRVSEILLDLGHKTVAFEPQAQCVRELKARCSPYKKNLHVEETALGDTPGSMPLYIRESIWQTSLSSAWEGRVTGVVQIQVSTLDIAIQRFGVPHYCKIDVEGWELQALMGLSQPIPLISFEYHQGNGKMQDAYACLDRLESLAKIEINITASERFQFAMDEWLEPEEFKADFQEKFEGMSDFSYGDLFVRMTENRRQELR
jgi:FkbM family methyltransferase